MVIQKNRWQSTTGCRCILERTYLRDISAKTRGQLASYYADDPEELATQITHLEENQVYDSVVTSYAIVRQCPEHAGLSADAMAAAFLACEKTTVAPVCCRCQYVQLVTRPEGEPIFAVGADPANTRLCEDHEHLRNDDGTVPHEAHFDVLLKEYQAASAVQQKAAEQLGLDPTAIPVTFQKHKKDGSRTPQVNFAALGVKDASGFKKLAAHIQETKDAASAVTGLPAEMVSVAVNIAADGEIQVHPSIDLAKALPELVTAHLRRVHPNRVPLKAVK